ncbi:MAG: DNA-directed RNA polymerase subunit omega [Clostridia bacterium]|nr:DNA-directed RNA polymerase subunit omega [Clostridia bacterium]MBR6361158.1 DNA-directed RNA polymerase subunit omega [Clostridia bacterium]
MFNPDLSGVLQNHLSRYSLVTATAKRAREIAEEANDEGEILTEKPVSLALDEILDGEFVIVEPEEIRNL